jgi:hypothetical protein
MVSQRRKRKAVALVLSSESEDELPLQQTLPAGNNNAGLDQAATPHNGAAPAPAAAEAAIGVAQGTAAEADSEAEGEAGGEAGRASVGKRQRLLRPGAEGSPPGSGSGSRRLRRRQQQEQGQEEKEEQGQGEEQEQEQDGTGGAQRVPSSGGGGGAGLALSRSRRVLPPRPQLAAADRIRLAQQAVLAGKQPGSEGEGEDEEGAEAQEDEEAAARKEGGGEEEEVSVLTDEGDPDAASRQLQQPGDGGSEGDEQAQSPAPGSAQHAKRWRKHGPPHSSADASPGWQR